MTFAARPEVLSAAADPMVEALAAVAREISSMAEVSDRLQALISAALMADGSRNADHMREFQAIDLLVQRLQGVSIFVDALACQASPDWQVDVADAAAGVPLSDLARRLTGYIEAPAEAGPEPDIDGDFELF